MLEKELAELEAAVPHRSKFNASVSKTTAGWQIVHALKVIQSIMAALDKSDPAKYSWSFSMSRVLVLALNYIPRGGGKAPKFTRPEEADITDEGISELLREVRTGLAEIDRFDKNSYFRHQYFGKMNLKNTKRFLKVHTTHHLKIVRDILKS